MLDFIGQPDKLGKPIGVDVKQGVYTLPVIKLVKESGKTKTRSLLSGSSLKLNEAFDKNGIITQILAEINEYNHSATTSLSSLRSEIIAGLKDLPEQLLLSANLTTK